MTTPEPDVPPVLSQPGPSKDKTSFAARYVMAGVFSCLLSFLTVAAITFSLPKIFEGHAVIAIGTVSRTPEQQQPGTGPSDRSALLQTHAQRIRSEVVLLQVVKDEMLIAKWGIAGTEDEATKQCLGFLGSRLETQPVLGTNLIEIISYSIDPKEAADVANCVAKVYDEFVRLENKGEEVRISNIAMPPATPSKPNVSLYLGVGFLGAAGLGAMICGFMFLVDHVMRRYFKTVPFPRNASRNGGKKTKLNWLLRIATLGVMLFVFGREFVKQGDDIPQQAAGGQTRVAVPNQESAKAYRKRGLDQLEKGDFDGAIADYTRAIELDARNAEAYAERAIAKNKKNNFDGAIADLNCAVELDPKLTVAYSLRAFAKFSKGDLEGAIADYDRIIEINPRFNNAYRSRGFVKFKKQDFDGAMADYDEAAKLDPKGTANLKERYVEACLGRGDAKFDKGDFDGAIADSSLVIGIDPTNGQGYANRGFAKHRKGDFDGSIADLNRAIELNPQNATAYYCRGLDKFKKHDYDGAITDYDQSAKLDPKNSASRNWSYVEAYFCRGHDRMEKSDLDGVIEDFSRVLERDPKNFAAYKARCWAYARKGDYNRAWADVKKCRELGGAMGDDFIESLSKASGRTE